MLWHKAYVSFRTKIYSYMFVNCGNKKSVVVAFSVIIIIIIRLNTLIAILRNVYTMLLLNIFNKITKKARNIIINNKNTNNAIHTKDSFFCTSQRKLLNHIF